MPVESASDFSSYLNPRDLGVTATFFEVQNALWDSRLSLIDTWYDIDSGDSKNINIVFDKQYFGIPGGEVTVDSFQPTATIKTSDAQYLSHNDRLIVNAITTNSGAVINPETTYLVKNVQPTNTGFSLVKLEKQ